MIRIRMGYDDPRYFSLITTTIPRKHCHYIRVINAITGINHNILTGSGNQKNISAGG